MYIKCINISTDGVFDGLKGANNLDYISCWFYLASKYIINYKKCHWWFVQI